MAMGNHCTPSTHRKRLRLHLRRVGLLRPQNRQQSSQTPDIKMLVTAGDAPLTHISLERGHQTHHINRSDPIRARNTQTEPVQGQLKCLPQISYLRHVRRILRCMLAFTGFVAGMDLNYPQLFQPEIAGFLRLRSALRGN